MALYELRLPEPGEPGTVGHAIQQLGDSLAGLAAWKRQRALDQQQLELARMRESREAEQSRLYGEQVKAQMEGQKRANAESEQRRLAEMAAVRGKAAALLGQGLRSQAESLLGAYGMKMSDVDASASNPILRAHDARRAAEWESDGRQLGALTGRAGASPEPMDPDAPLPMSQPEDVAPSMPQSMGGSAVPDQLDGGRSMDAMTPQATNPLIAARQAQLAREQATSRQRAEVAPEFRALRAQQVQGDQQYQTLTGGSGGPQAPQRPTYQVVDGAGNAFTIDPYEGERFTDQQRQQRLAQMDAALEKSSDPFLRKYFPVVRQAIAGGLLKPEDAFDKMAELKRLDDTREARMRRGGGTGRLKPPKPATEGQAKANAFLTVITEDARAIESLPPLSEAGRQTLFEELALRNAAEKNPGMDYAARLTGIRQTVEQKLPGTDRQAYAAYLSLLDPLVRQRTGAAAPPGEVAQLAGPIMPASGDAPADLAAKRKRRRKILESFAAQSNKTDDWLTKIGEIYEAPAAGKAQVSDDDQAAVEWARANKNDPRAKAILEANGLAQ